MYVGLIMGALTSVHVPIPAPGVLGSSVLQGSGSVCSALIASLKDAGLARCGECCSTLSPATWFSSLF